jgi:GH43 family beta-xylosidase
MARFLIVLLFLTRVNICSGQEKGYFTNPLFSTGPDPWIIRANGLYYYVSSSGTGIVIRSGKNLDDLKKSQPKSVWKAPEGTMWSKEVWAPELHFINNKWYLYFAADNGQNSNHRMYVIENQSPDPLVGEWLLKGKVGDVTDKWAIDGSVFEFREKLFMIWSGWEGDVNGQQNIYMTEMENPWTVGSRRVLISEPEYEWERVGDLNNANDVPHVNVNEGPVALVHKGKLFIFYSASGCWTDSYCLGMITFSGGKDLLDPTAWKKSSEPVFRGDTAASVFSPGHNSFFPSPDGKEMWVVYHANPLPGQGCGKYRSPRAQKISWKKDGTPNLGKPLRTDIPLKLPSGK